MGSCCSSTMTDPYGGFHTKTLSKEAAEIRNIVADQEKKANNLGRSNKGNHREGKGNSDKHYQPTGPRRLIDDLYDEEDNPNEAFDVSLYATKALPHTKGESLFGLQEVLKRVEGDADDDEPAQSHRSQTRSKHGGGHSAQASPVPSAKKPKTPRDKGHSPTDLASASPVRSGEKGHDKARRKSHTYDSSPAQSKTPRDSRRHSVSYDEEGSRSKTPRGGKTPRDRRPSVSYEEPKIFTTTVASNADDDDELHASTRHHKHHHNRHHHPH